MNSHARALRRNASLAENRLWYVLRNRGLDRRKFVRQHATSTADAARTAYLNAQGYAVLRFWNNEVIRNRDGVLLAIRSVIAGSPSPDLRFAPATLSPMGRGTRGIRAAASSQRVAYADPEIGKRT